MSGRAEWQPHVTRWGLTPDGEAVVTPTGWLLPMRWRGEPAMLKVATVDEERRGADLLAWYAGDGAVCVHGQDGDATLMERAVGPHSLAALARRDDTGDDEATRILCAVAARLHATEGRGPLPSTLVPLDVWFRALPPGAERHGGRLPILRTAAGIAHGLLTSQLDVVPLHGDLHHGNVLDAGHDDAGHDDAGGRGWLAIDPKGLLGERGFDYANLFRNPDHTGAPDGLTATRPGRLARRADVVAEAADLARDRLLRWVVALCGLSACWCLEDGVEPVSDLAVAELALADMRRTG